MSTISVIVQTSYPLYDDDAEILPQDGQVHVVKDTDKIQSYIQLGQLVEVPDSAPVASAEAPAEPAEEEQPQQSVKKARTSVQKENSDG